MNVGELLGAASRNPWVFAGLALLALVSAWQPLTRLFLALVGLVRGVYNVGVVRTAKKYRDSVDAKAEEILKRGNDRNTFIISYTTFSIIGGIQAIMSFLIGLSIFQVLPQLPKEIQEGLVPAGFLFITLAFFNTLIWMFDGAYQLLVHMRLRKLLDNNDS